MWRRGPVSLQFFFRTSVVVFALTIVCAAMAAHERIRHESRQLLFRREAEMMAKSVVRSFAMAARSDSSELSEMCARAIEPGAVLAASVFDSTGRVLAHSQMTGEFEGFLLSHRPADFATGAAVVTPLTEKDSPIAALGTITSVYAPLPAPGVSESLSLGLIAQLDLREFAGDSSLWQFHLPMACILIGGVFVMDVRLRRKVVGPIRALANPPSASEDADPEPTQQGNQLLELAELSDQFDALRADGRLWRRRAEITERRVDTHVARETKRIIRDLNRVKQEAWADALTGVNNRRFLEEQFPQIFEAQRSSNRDLSVIMFDVDNFKLLNDSHGHAAGDDVLRFVGELLRQCLRSDDCAIRYGGDEFFVMLPGIGVDGACKLADRILALFAQRVKMMFATDLPPTMTAGVAGIVHNQAGSPAELLACADHALIAAKQAGKRQARISTIQGRHFRASGRTMRIPIHSSTPLSAKL